MKTPVRYFLAILVIGLGTALWATSPGASSEHFVVTNNLKHSDLNTGTVLKLGGTRTKPSLRETATLSTNVMDYYGGASPNVVAVSHGPNICLFLANAQNPGNEISAFVYPGFSQTGNYNDPSVTYSNYGIALAARGNFLLASYGDNISYTGSLAVWRIRSGCALELLSTSSTKYPAGSLAVSPDGKTLVVEYSGGSALLNGADSFSISADGKLTEHGPYGVNNASSMGGIDITADSKYALFAVTGFYPDDYTQVGIFPINPDGSLGRDSDWGGRRWAWNRPRHSGHTPEPQREIYLCE